MLMTRWSILGGRNMKCPYCGEENTKVIDSRPAEENNAIRRRRQCLKCKKRFTTYEKVDIREPYDRGKIEAGIVRSCHKRPVSYEQIVSAVEDVENKIFNMEKKEISSRVIGEIVMERLKELDQVAYVRFASVYREFKDVNTFMDELKKLLK